MGNLVSVKLRIINIISHNRMNITFVILSPKMFNFNLNMTKQSEKNPVCEPLYGTTGLDI